MRTLVSLLKGAWLSPGSRPWGGYQFFPRYLRQPPSDWFSDRWFVRARQAVSFAVYPAGRSSIWPPMQCICYGLHDRMHSGFGSRTTITRLAKGSGSGRPRVTSASIPTSFNSSTIDQPSNDAYTCIAVQQSSLVSVSRHTRAVFPSSSFSDDVLDRKLMAPQL